MKDSKRLSQRVPLSPESSKIKFVTIIGGKQ